MEPKNTQVLERTISPAVLTLLDSRLLYQFHCWLRQTTYYWFPWLLPTMGPNVAKVWIQLSHENGVVSVVTRQPFMLWPWLVQVCSHLRSLNVHHFENGWSYEVTVNVMTSLLNVMKIYQLVQKLLAGSTLIDRSHKPRFYFLRK
jgi:hypothetical protein